MNARLQHLAGGADRLVVVDSETTGLYDNDRIVEIALVTLSTDGDLIDVWETLINPQREVSATFLHGITDSMVASAPPFEEIAGDIATRLDGACLVAHNVSFDYNFLKVWLERVSGERFTKPHLCTVKLSQLLLDPSTGSRKLHNLARTFGIPLQNRHRAYDDANATALILVELLKELPARNIHTLADLKLYESGWTDAQPVAHTGTDDAVADSSS